jgi:hypothetical protein
MGHGDAPLTDFRALCAALHGAVAERLDVALDAKRVELAAAGHVVVFEGVTRLAWRSGTPAPLARFVVRTLGLERLKPGDVWRLLLAPEDGTELELACARVTCDGVEVQGVGRSWRESAPG